MVYVMDGFTSFVNDKKLEQQKKDDLQIRNKHLLFANRSKIISLICNALGFKSLEKWMLHFIHKSCNGQIVSDDELKELESLLSNWKEEKQNGDKNLQS